MNQSTHSRVLGAQVAILSDSEFAATCPKIDSTLVPQQLDPVLFDPDHDFLERSTKNAFADLRCHPFVGPRLLDIGTKFQTSVSVFLTQPHVYVGLACTLQRVRDRLYRDQTLIPPALQFTRHLPVLRINGIILPPRTPCLVLCTLERDFMLPNRLQLGIGIRFDGAKRRIHADRFENAHDLATNRFVRWSAAERDALVFV